jgi:hypothetical protein
MLCSPPGGAPFLLPRGTVTDGLETGLALGLEETNPQSGGEGFRQSFGLRPAKIKEI